METGEAAAAAPGAVFSVYCLARVRSAPQFPRSAPGGTAGRAEFELSDINSSSAAAFYVCWAVFLLRY